MTRGLHLSPAPGDPAVFADHGHTSAALWAVPAEWIDGYQEILLHRWLARRIPQGIRRKNDPSHEEIQRRIRTRRPSAPCQPK